MSDSLIQRLVNRLKGKHDAASDDVEVSAPEQREGRDSIASDVDSKRWFEGKPPAPPPIPRDPIDSDPVSARWFRRPRFVAPGDALH
ncbi:MAG: hypothetical protein ACXWUG_26185, partial [Polyangiales bacterium]